MIPPIIAENIDSLNLARQTVKRYRRRIDKLCAKLREKVADIKDLRSRLAEAETDQEARADRVRLDLLERNEVVLATQRGMQARITELESECADLCRKLSAAMDELERREAA